MASKNIRDILKEIETQFEGGFRQYDERKVESSLRTCMYLGQFAAPKEMNKILIKLKEKFPNGFDRSGNTYDVADEFLRILKAYVDGKDLNDLDTPEE